MSTRLSPNSRPWIFVGALVVLPVVLWASAHPMAERFGSFPLAVRSLANVTGLLGTASFAVNVALGARLRLLVRLFAGLEPMYRYHRFLGAAVGALLLAHALLASAATAWRSPAAPFELFLPAAGWAVFVGTVALAALITGLGFTFFARLPHEMFVSVQRALGLTFVLGAVHVFGVQAARADVPLAAFVGLLMSVGVAAFLYRSVLGRFVARHVYCVEHVSRPDNDVAVFRLAPLAAPLSFLPGQFVFASFIDDSVGAEVHPFSIASSPSAGTLDIVVKALGDHTSRMMNVRSGAKVRLEGPFGSFSYLRIDNPRQIWIAGGIGVTPFLSMARAIDASAYEIDLYYCTERSENSYFLDELFEISQRDLRLRVIPVRKTSLGRINADDIREASGGVKGKDILICGPPAMLRNLRTQFLASGVPPGRIHYEDFAFLEPRRANTAFHGRLS